ncbi:hypothetical protein H0H92_015618 [Tricholoma furcatifolium]|nr:hypothetical protein H0H92_015618 [Tricholoma furcatifolium]
MATERKKQTLSDVNITSSTMAVSITIELDSHLSATLRSILRSPLSVETAVEPTGKYGGTGLNRILTSPIVRTTYRTLGVLHGSNGTRNSPAENYNSNNHNAVAPDFAFEPRNTITLLVTDNSYIYDVQEEAQHVATNASSAWRHVVVKPNFPAFHAALDSLRYSGQSAMQVPAIQESATFPGASDLYLSVMGQRVHLREPEGRNVTVGSVIDSLIVSLTEGIYTTGNSDGHNQRLLQLERLIYDRETWVLE